MSTIYVSPDAETEAWLRSLICANGGDLRRMENDCAGHSAWVVRSPTDISRTLDRRLQVAREAFGIDPFRIGEVAR